MEAVKKGLNGDTEPRATRDEADELRKGNLRLKEMIADLMLQYNNVKKA